MPRSVATFQRWLAEREADLVRPDGWLSLIGLTWLDPGRSALGSAAACPVRLPAGPELQGELEQVDSHVIWHPRAGDSRVLKSDASGEPDVVSLDERFSFFIIAREHRLAARVRDRQAAGLRDFAGISRYPFDPTWVIDACWQDGLAVFAHGGTAYALRPQVSAADPLLFVIADATTGGTTYGGGRFLRALAAEDDRLVLDFNRAVNPPCALTPFATCPLPPAENRLPFALAAGELAYRPSA